MLALVFWMGIWQKRDTGISDKLPLNLICPQFICEWSFDFLGHDLTKVVLFILCYNILLISFKRYEHKFRFLSIDLMQVQQAATRLLKQFSVNVKENTRSCKTEIFL
jgi:hypothetical protein